MGTALTGSSVASKYNALLKTTANSDVDATLRTISDGLGNDSALQISTLGIKSLGTLAVAGATTLTGALTLSGGLSTPLAIAQGGTAAATANLARAALNKGTVALTDAATVATDCALGNVFTVTLGGNRTLGAPTNQAAGATYIWIITQDGTGSRTLSFNAAFKFPAGADPTLTTTAAAVDIVSGVSDGTSIYATALLNLS